MPAWTLPDDDSGLDAMLRSQVRMNQFLTHTHWRPAETCSMALSQCVLDCHAGSREAPDGCQLCADNASGKHDPPLPVAAFSPSMGDSVLQALHWCALSFSAVIWSPAPSHIQSAKMLLCTTHRMPSHRSLH
jgi:hypothetical protein